MALKPAMLMGETAQPRPAQHRPIDLVHLAKQCLGDEGLEHEVLRLFATAIETYQARLLAAGNVAELAIQLHTIKSAASGVGAWTILALAKAGEVDLRDRGALQDELIADLSIAIEETRSFIDKLVGNLPA